MPPILTIPQTADQAAWTLPQATEEDIYLLLARRMSLVDKITGPMQIGVGWSSWADAQDALYAGLDPRISIVVWGIEYNNPGEPLPADEAADIPGWIAKARADCDNYGRQLMIVPDNYYGKLYGAQIAAMCDIRGWQIQRYQNNIKTVKTRVAADIAVARFGPRADLFEQVYPGDTTRGGVAAALAAWNAIASLKQVTGVGFFNSGTDADWAAVQQAIATLRP